MLSATCGARAENSSRYARCPQSNQDSHHIIVTVDLFHCSIKSYYLLYCTLIGWTEIHVLVLVLVQIAMWWIFVQIAVWWTFAQIAMWWTFVQIAMWCAFAQIAMWCAFAQIAIWWSFVQIAMWWAFV